jgi:hypothetical protein
MVTGVVEGVGVGVGSSVCETTETRGKTMTDEDGETGATGSAYTPAVSSTRPWARRAGSPVGQRVSLMRFLVRRVARGAFGGGFRKREEGVNSGLDGSSLRLDGGDGCDGTLWFR